MEVFEDYLAAIDNPQHRERLVEIFAWIAQRFPILEQKLGWNQPMFTDHGTYIIGFSISKQHMAVAPEKVGMDRFSAAIEQAGYSHTQLLFRIKWDQAVNYELLAEIIEFNIMDKLECTTFWR